MSFPSQAECDLSNPKEHLLWALRGVGWGNHPIVIPQAILETWSEQLVNAGAVHVLALYALADADGKIDINDLPRQRIKYITHETNGGHPLNGAGQWVPVDAVEPVVTKTDTLTPVEKAAMAEQLREEGYL